MIAIELKKILQATQGKMHLDVSFNLNAGKFLAIYGKSGAGKTSILRMLAGLLQADTGKIIVHQKTWFDHQKKIFLKPQQRQIGYLFQDYSLFPNMTVEGNLLFALPKGVEKKRISELIDVMELGDLRRQKPHLLSGGQQQRVALARALVQHPQLLLLDEPLSAVDHEMRHKLQDYILNVHQQFNLTTILISHDKAEVQKMADRIIHLDQGKIIKDALAADFFDTQKSKPIKGTIVALDKNHLWVQIASEKFKIPRVKPDSIDYKIGSEILLNIQIITKE